MLLSVSSLLRGGESGTIFNPLSRWGLKLYVVIVVVSSFLFLVSLEPFGRLSMYFSFTFVSYFLFKDACDDALVLIKQKKVILYLLVAYIFWGLPL